MKKFIVLFREPDGRTREHSKSEAATHQASWKDWLSVWGQKGRIQSGSGLSLDGRIVKNKGNTITTDIHRNDLEIVGGYLLLQAEDFDEAVQIIRTCPIFEYDGYAEIRELLNLSNQGSVVNR